MFLLGSWQRLHRSAPLGALVFFAIEPVKKRFFQPLRLFSHRRPRPYAPPPPTPTLRAAAAASFRAAASDPDPDQLLLCSPEASWSSVDALEDAVVELEERVASEERGLVEVGLGREQERKDAVVELEATGAFLTRCGHRPRVGPRSKVQGSRRREEQERESRVAAMVVREKEMDGEGEKFGQQFFRVFMPQLYEERLRIPPAFHQYLQNQPTGVVSLKAQSGNTWLAELASDTEGLFFGHGWKEFVIDHSLEFGNFLTFRYDGRSQFSVVVFDKKCIEKPSSFHAKPCKDLVIKIENDEGDMEINATEPSEIPSAPSEESNETTRKRIREMDLNDSTLKKCYSALENGRKRGHGTSVGSFKAAPTHLNMDNNTVDPSEVVPLEERNANRMRRVGEMGMNDSTLKNSSIVLEKSKEVSEASVGTYKAAGPSEVMVASIEKSCIATRKRVREMDTDGSILKKFSNVSEKSKQQSLGTSVSTYKLASTSLNRTKDSDSSSSMQEESILCNKSAESMQLLQRVNKDVPKHGKSIMTSQRQPAVISQRPPITEEQKNHALQKAKRFKSKNPFVLQIMKESYVYVGFFMKLPCEFVRECLPRTSKNIKLWDPEGKAWDVKYIYYKEQSCGAFSGGWSRFSLGNSLEKFDVCVFELFAKDNIKVHIYRVVPEITPFLPGSNSK